VLFGKKKSIVFVCVQLFRTVQVNHLLIYIFELGLKVCKIVTTETVMTKTCLPSLFW